jgi:two-component SAPR family response regulator
MPAKTEDIAVPITACLAQKEYSKGVKLLIEYSRDLLQPGRLAELKKLLELVPKEYFLSHPKLILISANADYQSGELKASLRQLISAIPVLKKTRDLPSFSAAYRYLSYIYQDMGQNQKAIQACKSGLKYLDKRDYRGRAGLLSVMAGSYWRLLDYEKASRTYHKVMNIYIRAGDKEGQIRTLANSSAITMTLGELDRARRDKEEVLRFYQNSGNRRSYLMAAVNLSSLYLVMFELEKAEMLLTSIIPEIQELGLGMLLGPARVYLGEVQTHQRRFSEAEKTLKYALDNTDSAREASYYSSCLIALSTRYRLKEDCRAAKKYGLEALENTSPERPLDAVQAYLNMSRIHAAIGELPQARQYAQKSLVVYAKRKMNHRHALALLGLADVYRTRKNHSAFIETFSRALALCQRYKYDFLFDSRFPDGYWSLVTEYRRLGGTSNYAKKVDAKFAPVKSPFAGEASPNDISIRTFGDLALSINGRLVERWKRKSSRQVLEILLSRQISSSPQPIGEREQFIPAEVISLMLWPKKSLAAASLNLQVAVAELRRILEPGLKDGKASRYVEFREGSYRIDMKGISADFLDFAGLARKGSQAEVTGQHRAAMEFYRQAVECYRGDFLQEVRVVELEGVREHLRQSYFRALLSLAKLCLEHGHPNQAVKYASLAVSKERCLEEAHRILISAYHRLGRKELISKQFQLCRTALRRDLGLDVSAKTIAIYKECSD